MGRYTLFHDFLCRPDRLDANYSNAPFEMKYLGDDDDKLLVPALFHLGREGRMRIRNNSTLKQGATVRMIEVTPLLMKLRGHKYNIFESCFLMGIGDYTYIHAQQLGYALLQAAFYLIAQVLLFFILVYYSVGDDFRYSVSTDGLTIVVVVITTVFFNKLAYPQWKDVYNFNALFWRVGFGLITGLRRLRSIDAMLIINLLVNGGLPAVIIAFNIYYQLSAKDLEEAIFNGISLLFFIQINDTLKPDLDEKHFDMHLAVNVMNYINVGGWDHGGVQVDIISKSTEEDYLHLLERSDGKAHFILTEDNHQVVAAVFWSRRDGMNEEEKYRIVQFCISGENGQDLFNNIEKFHCVQNDKLEYHELGKFLLEALSLDALSRDDSKNSAEVQEQPVCVVPDSRAVSVSTSRSGHGENSATSVDSSSSDAPSDELSL